MAEALGAGVNFFDTADVYGGTQSPDMEKGSASLRTSSAIGWRRKGGMIGSCLRPRFTSQMGTEPNDRSLTLSGEIMARLDEIWPGLGGEAPVAYAW
jgi:hypothetical protein